MVRDYKPRTMLLRLARGFFLPALTHNGVQVSPYAYTVALIRGFISHPQTHNHGRKSQSPLQGNSLV